MTQNIKSFTTYNGMSIEIEKINTKFDTQFLDIIGFFAILASLSSLLFIKAPYYFLSIICTFFFLIGWFFLKYSRKYYFVIDESKRVVFCKETIFYTLVVGKTREIPVADGMVIKIQIKPRVETHFSHGKNIKTTYYPVDLIYLSQAIEDTLLSHEDCNERIYQEYLLIANSLKKYFNFTIYEEPENKRCLYVIAKNPKYSGIYSKDHWSVDFVLLFLFICFSLLKYWL